MYLLFCRLKAIVRQGVASGAGVGVALGADGQSLLPGEGADEGQAMGQALGAFDLQRVVPGVAQRIPVSENGSELRERAE